MSESLGGFYRRVSHDPESDIAPHFATFGRVVEATQARTIVELGVRDGHSTAAWLWNIRTGGHLWSVDIEPNRLPYRNRWTFIVGNDLDPAVAEHLPDVIDVLFIDTNHAYDQTLAELALYGPRVRAGGAIVLHDTENEHPEDHGEPIGPQEPFPVRRAMRTWADAHDFDVTEFAGSWGLGIIWIPPSA